MTDSDVEKMELDTILHTLETVQSSLLRCQRALRTLESQLPRTLLRAQTRQWIATTPEAYELVREVGIREEVFQLAEFLQRLNQWLVETRQVNLGTYEVEPSEFLQGVLGCKDNTPFSYPTLLKMLQGQLCVC